MGLWSQHLERGPKIKIFAQNCHNIFSLFSIFVKPSRGKPSNFDSLKHYLKNIKTIKTVNNSF